MSQPVEQRPLDATDLDNIESMAKKGFAHHADTLRLVARVRELAAEVAEHEERWEEMQSAAMDGLTLD